LIFTSHIPQSPGIYIFKDSDGAILYIGKAKNLLKRVQQYFTPGSLWKQDMLSHATNIEHIVVQSDNEAYLLESNLIKQHQPPYNSLLKWDNSYIFVKITNEDFGQITLTRKEVMMEPPIYDPNKILESSKTSSNTWEQYTSLEPAKKASFV
jgi:excinuclease ABC subunit C